MRTIHKCNLKLGKLSLPISLYKSKDNTTSVYAKEVIKIGGQIHKVQRKPYYVNELGKEIDIDSSQILKQYEKDDGEPAIFTKAEQTELLKMGSDRDWDIVAVVDKNQFDELAFQKEGVIVQVEMDKKKEIVNKKNLKFLQMLKAGLQEKVMVAQILYKNVQYPIAIMNYGDNLLMKFVSYSDEIRDIDRLDLPQLTEAEQEKAKAFVQQMYKPDFSLKEFKNTTQERIMCLINSRGTEITETKVEEVFEDPFTL